MTIQQIVRAVFVGVAIAGAASVSAARPDESPKKSEGAAKEDARFVAYPDAPSVTHHTLDVGGETIHYTSTAGVITLTDHERKPTANVFYIAYRRTLRPHAEFEKEFRAWEEAGAKGERPVNTPEASTRPITFSFNGGPGSSSVWLHLGVFGPKRVAYADEKGNPGAPPYGVIPNDHTLLDVSDFVFIDPVSTGFSRAEEGTSAKDFHGVEKDIESVGEFIRRYLTNEQRWRSPKFIAGESYGTTRAAGLSQHLHTRHGVALNGVILISSAMQFGTIRFDTGNDLPYILFLPTYAATAHYHRAVAQEHQDKPLDAFVREVEAFASGEYAAALMQGSNLKEETASRIVERLASYTGLSPDYIRRTRLRIEIGRFTKELLRERGQTVGRLDSRFTGMDRDDAGERYSFDPSYAAIYGNYTASLNAYVREELGFASDLPYEILTNVWPWSYDAGGTNRYLDVAERLRAAMHEQPHLQVFLASGYFDLATPHFASDYVISHMGLAGDLLGNVRTRYYPAGHMMYVHAPSLIRLEEDLEAFYADALPAQDR